MGIKAIFFDLDDTLHDHLLPFSNAFKSTFPIYLEELPIESLYKHFRDSSDVLWKSYSNHKLTLVELRINRIVLALKSFKISISNQKASEFQEQYDRGLKDLHLFPEARNLLETMKSKEYVLGIITNGPTQHQYNKIKSLGLTRYISRELIFISDEVGLAKPNPQIFHHVVQKTSFSPNELLYIGDTWSNDIVASNEAGWQSIWYNHRSRQPETDHRTLAEIKSLSSVMNILREAKEKEKNHTFSTTPLGSFK